MLSCGTEKKEDKTFSDFQTNKRGASQQRRTCGLRCTPELRHPILVWLAASFLTVKYEQCLEFQGLEISSLLTDPNIYVSSCGLYAKLGLFSGYQFL